MRKIILFFLSVFVFALVGAQSLRKPVATAQIGLSAYSQHQKDVFSFSSNQAALAQIKEPAFGVFSERRFSLLETTFFSAIAALPTKEGNFGLEADYFGYKNYSETQVGIAYARNVGKKLDVGIKFNYYSFRIPGYQNSGVVNFEAGAIAHLTEQLHAGIHFYNPVRATLSKTVNEKLPAIFKFGIGYDASENFFIGAEIIKEENLPVNVAAGMQYNFEKKFFARAGIQTENSSPYFGAGFFINNFRLDVTAAFHPQLGVTPGVQLIMDLKKQQEQHE